HENREREPAALAAREPGDRFLRVLAGEEEAAEQGSRLVGREAGGTLRDLEHRAPGSHLLGVLAEVADLRVVPPAQLAAVELAPPGERLDEGRLAGAVRAHERHVLAALEPELHV